MNHFSFENLFTTQNDPWFLSIRKSQSNRFMQSIKLLKRYAPHTQNLLDVGCALGNFTNILSNAFPKASITAIDISPTAIQKAQEKYPHIKFETQTLPHLPYQDNSLDTICALEILYLLSEKDQHKTFDRFYSLLKENGTVFITASCDPASMDTHDLLLKKINKSKFSIIYNKPLYGYTYYELEKNLIYIHNVCLEVNKEGKYLLIGKTIRFFIKKIIHSSLLFHLLTLPSRILKRRPLHQILILKKI